MLEYYSPISARIKKHLAVATNHSLYIEEYGNPAGIPVIVMHGGPGSSCNPDMARYFNPEMYRIVLYDQRGCGKSIPRNSIENNTSEELIEDVEKIRVACNLGKLVLFGGSWGSTLALLYAERYPQHIRALILRGIYLGGDSAYMQENSIAARTSPNHWIAFKKTVFPYNPQDAQSYEALLSALYQCAINDDPNVWHPVAMALARWEAINSCAEQGALKSKLEKLANDTAVMENALTMGRMEIVYKANRFWLADNQILDAAYKLKDIPVYIVHGLNDKVCHPDFPRQLIEQLQRTNCRFLHVTWTDAGHSGTEPATLSALVAAADEQANSSVV